MHRPVMLRETVARMGVRAGGSYVDATLGGVGHARALLEASGPDGRLLGLDADPAAVARAAGLLADYGARAVVRHARFSALGRVAAEAGFGAVDGVLLDLGVSSFQIDEAARGFSFQREGPLDMRMNPEEPVTAADLVNGLPEGELADLFRRLGEERAAVRIARRIARRRAARPFRTTTDLAGVVAAAAGGRRGRVHPATRVFQALRMAVNREREELEAGLEAAVRLLAPGGRLAVIAFHSLEDRAVKRRFARHVGREESLQAGGSRLVFEPPRMARVTRGAERPSAAECADNPRARSARLRVAERTG